MGDYDLIELHENDPHCIRITNLFLNTARQDMVLDYVERVKNPYLQERYAQKLGYYTSHFNKSPAALQQELFHGTLEENVDSICRYNLDTSYIQNDKFGHGVSFTRKSSYAFHYCNEEPDDNVMFVFNVIVNKVCRGSKGMAQPPHGFDTTANKNGDVIVKYSTRSYCPKFLIHFYQDDGSSTYDDDDANVWY